jgi:hypothetical protein
MEAQHCYTTPSNENHIHGLWNRDFVITIMGCNLTYEFVGRIDKSLDYYQIV